MELFLNFVHNSGWTGTISSQKLSISAQHSHMAIICGFRLRISELRSSERILNHPFGEISKYSDGIAPTNPLTNKANTPAGNFFAFSRNLFRFIKMSQCSNPNLASCESENSSAKSTAPLRCFNASLFRTGWEIIIFYHSSTDKLERKFPYLYAKLGWFAGNSMIFFLMPHEFFAF